MSAEQGTEIQKKIYFVNRSVASSLEQFTGIGPKKSSELLRQFGGLEAIKCASVNDLARVKGIWRPLAQRIYNFYHNPDYEFVGGNVVYQWFRRSIPNYDESTWTYPTGKFTTWLRTNEIRKALENDHIKEIYEILLTRSGDKSDKQKWKKLRQEALNQYGRKCMRCGTEEGSMEVDHIKQFSWYPTLRYDIENLQVLCVGCHRWKTQQERLDPLGKRRKKVDKLNFRVQR